LEADKEGEMKITIVSCVLMVAVLPGRAGRWRDDFEDGDYGGWTVQNVGGGFSEWEVKFGELTAWAAIKSY
jgi:hypothetical protein